MLPGEALIRVAALLAVFAAIAIGEAAAPRRSRSYSRMRRWPSNLAITALDTGLLRVLFPATAVSLALAGEKHHWGLLNNCGASPWWLAMAASVILLDLAIYLQHVMFHAVPALWRVHRMHHADLVST